MSRVSAAAESSMLSKNARRSVLDILDVGNPVWISGRREVVYINSCMYCYVFVGVGVRPTCLGLLASSAAGVTAVAPILLLLLLLL